MSERGDWLRRLLADGVYSPMPEEIDCPVCGLPIKWCLDMFSFTTGPHHQLAHARCVWKQEAFPPALAEWAADARDALARAAENTRRIYAPEFRDDIEIRSPGTQLESLTLAEVAALLARYEEIGGGE